jgi:hypothetical protein
MRRYAALTTSSQLTCGIILQIGINHRIGSDNGIYDLRVYKLSQKGSFLRLTGESSTCVNLNPHNEIVSTHDRECTPKCTQKWRKNS